VLERDVLGEVADQGAVVDDHIIGDEVVVSRHAQVVRLLLTDLLNRGDLVPPDI